MGLSRDEEKKVAMTAIVVDGKVPAALIEEIKAINGISEAHLALL